MKPNSGRAGGWVRRGAEGALALMLATMFVAFLIQIVLRYFFSLPTGWTSELTVTMWLWMVLWGSAFVLRDDEEIRLDLVDPVKRPRLRRVMGGLVAVALIVLYGIALPASTDYVSFMKVESSSYLKIRLDVLYSIFIVFLVAVMLRQAWLLWRLFRGDDVYAPLDAQAEQP